MQAALIREADPDAVKLAQKLDRLPFALAMAGTYLDLVPTSFPEHLLPYEESWPE